MTRAERRRIVIAGVVAGVGCLVAVATALWGSDLARRIPGLDVERVEISGASLLAPQEILAASGIQLGQHLLDEKTIWESGLRSHPVIAEASVSRDLPRTLRVRVVEKTPVAFVSDGTLRPATGAGELLPVDPSLVPLDLPVLRVEPTDSASEELMRRLLSETQRLGALLPGLLAEVSEIRPSPREPDVMVLVHPIGEILIPFGTDPRRAAELEAVLADLRSRTRAGEPDAASARARLDLRFADQIVVRHLSTSGTS
jgi:hypothetical protein